MDSYMPILLLSLCACACARGEPLPEAVQRRSDMFGVYASEYARGYEPVAYATVPLHTPIPVLHIISPVPLKSKRHEYRHAAPSGPQPAYARPYLYAASMNQYGYDQPAETTAPTILYARPNPLGGFTYRRRPLKNRNVPKRSATTDPPVIIRVHKYRIIRER